MIVDRLPLLDSINTPQEDSHAVEESGNCHDSESDGGSERDAVAEIEECGGDGAQYDGEFELEKVSIHRKVRRYQEDSPKPRKFAPQQKTPSAPLLQEHGSSCPLEP